MRFVKTVAAIAACAVLSGCGGSGGIAGAVGGGGAGAGQTPSPPDGGGSTPPGGNPTPPGGGTTPPGGGTTPPGGGTAPPNAVTIAAQRGQSHSAVIARADNALANGTWVQPGALSGTATMSGAMRAALGINAATNTSSILGGTVDATLDFDAQTVTGTAKDFATYDVNGAGGISGREVIGGTLAVSGSMTATDVSVNAQGQLVDNTGTTQGTYDVNTTTGTVVGIGLAQSGGDLYLETQGVTTGTFTPTGGAAQPLCMSGTGSPLCTSPTTGIALEQVP